ncbi:cytochrome P450 26B1-like [Arapaima gigas]
MFLLACENFSLLVTGLTSVLSVLLLLAVSRQLWTFRWTITRDRESKLPLPKGSMGWPIVGETLHWLVQGSNFHISRREKYGNVFKTHLLGKPVIRVTGAENIRKILLGEHSLVCTQWPQSTRIILGPNTLVNSTGDLHRQKRKVLAKVFSRRALETYVPRLQDVVRCEVAKWCSEPGSVDVYSASKALTFRIAIRVLLGLRVEESRVDYLSRIFEQLMNNLFSLPFDVPLSGLRKGIKAREILHKCMEKIIKEKLQKQQEEYKDEEHMDAFDYMLSGANDGGHEFGVQELKETAVELIFAAHSTTASASASLVLQFLKHAAVCDKARSELLAHGICGDALRARRTRSNTRNEAEPTYRSRDSDSGGAGSERRGEAAQESRPRVPVLTLQKLGELRYLDCVVKEVLRFLPPVSGGYRTALQTFELDGCQIPKGWSVMYSIRDTHETAAVYQSPDLFDPDRFGPERNESKAERFSYVPFGGGTRSCIGRELAQIILKTLAVELLATTEFKLSSETFPKMQTVPIVHPVGGLHVSFKCLHANSAA